MNLKITKTDQIQPDISAIYIIDNIDKLENHSFSPTELEFLKKQLDDEKDFVEINSYFKWSYVCKVKETEDEKSNLELYRKAANKAFKNVTANKHTDVIIVDLQKSREYTEAFIEGFLLSNYQFLKYFNDKDKKVNKLEECFIHSDSIESKQLDLIQNLTEAVYITRDLVNEPVSYLTSEQLAKEIDELGKEAGFKVEILNKKQIEALKMNGLLAVNKGSIDPPTFSIMEWKPENAKNEKPFVLVGKGIVYDTGGLSLKPTNYMDTMKSDMAGAAAVVGTMYAAAKNKLPIHIIGLVPATDNRPDGNAYTPGDVIEMHNGVTVEVLNTDAEGRMILADALSFAKEYNPELVIDIATLTGSASIAIGSQGMVGMGTADPKIFHSLIDSGFETHERVVQFPFWDEYKEMLKSNIADIKNIGGRDAGAITAGKFLEHFIDYPWIHLDIAGPSFLDKDDAYRTKGGSGVGVRLIYSFLQTQV